MNTGCAIEGITGSTLKKGPSSNRALDEESHGGTCFLGQSALLVGGSVRRGCETYCSQVFPIRSSRHLRSGVRNIGSGSDVVVSFLLAAIRSAN